MTTSTADRTIVALVLVLLGAILVLPILTMGFGMVGVGPMMGGPWGDGGVFQGWMVVVGVVQLLFLALLLGGGYLVVRALSGSSEERAIEELRIAYARGDLSEEEFESRRETLRRHD